MKAQWLDFSLEAAAKPAAFYSGCRKIHQGMTFTLRRLDNDLHMPDIGFTKSKMTMLTKNYVHEESRNVAVELWKGRLERAKYGSVGFHCFSHYVKGGTIESKRSKRASVMGPCIQSVAITLVSKGKTQVDLFYRTTELFKKFPADLVFVRDVLLAPFDFSTAPIVRVNFHFANVTCHPMYAVTLLPMLDDPVAELKQIKKKDKFFHDWIVKWTARYICPEHHRGIAKFSQALRTQKSAYDLLDKATLRTLQKYMRDNHPGHRSDYSEDMDDGSDSEL